MTNEPAFPATKHVDTSGLKLAYREYGEPSAQSVVLLHALGPDSRYWHDIAVALADVFHVLVPDFRGFGESGRPGQYSFELMRDDVLALVDRLGIDQFSLVGHSMGGTVSYLVAESAPGRIRKLVLEDTPPPGGSALPAPPAAPSEPVPFDWEALRAIIGQLNDPDPAWWDELPRISSPSLVICGGTTSTIPLVLLERVVAALPDARLATIEGAGHNVHTTRPAEFIALVREFLLADRAGVDREAQGGLV